MSAVLVVAEQRDGQPWAPGLQLCSAARGFGLEITAVTWGAGSPRAAPVLGAYGAGRVLDIGEVGEQLPAPIVATAVASYVSSGPPPPIAVLVAESYDGRDIAARLSARLDRPVLTNVVGLAHHEGSFVSSHAVFGGTAVVKARFTGPPPAIFVVRPKTFVASEGPPAGPEVVPAEAAVGAVGATAGARVVSRHVERAGTKSLDDARVVVAGGRGLGGPARYEFITELAELLGGAPGASRAIVDAGWAPYAYQVGQTGKTVKPDVYLAFGISGATQHLVGMKGAAHIVAVNNDPAAPILQVADLGVVGDVATVLPKLLEAVRARRGR